jgi:hypothetical protein
VNSDFRSAPRVVGSKVAMSKYRCWTKPDGFGLREVFAHSFHLGEGVLVIGAISGGYAFVEAGQGLLGATLFDEGLGGHLVGGDVVGIVVDEGGEFGEGEVGVALGVVLHGEAVAGEGVGGVELEDFV